MLPADFSLPASRAIWFIGVSEFPRNKERDGELDKEG